MRAPLIVLASAQGRHYKRDSVRLSYRTCRASTMSKGLKLVEIGLGIDLQTEIIDSMEIQPSIVSVKPLELRLFKHRCNE